MWLTLVACPWQSYLKAKRVFSRVCSCKLGRNCHVRGCITVAAMLVFTCPNVKCDQWNASQTIDSIVTGIRNEITCTNGYKRNATCYPRCGKCMASPSCCTAVLVLFQSFRCTTGNFKRCFVAFKFGCMTNELGFMALFLMLTSKQLLWD